MTPEQIQATIQEKFHTALYQKTFLGKDRAAKDALNTRIKNGKWFGKFFHTFLSVLEACGLEVSPGWSKHAPALYEEPGGAYDEGTYCMKSKDLITYVNGDRFYICQYLELQNIHGAILESGFYSEEIQDYIKGAEYWKPLDKNHR